MLGFGFVKPMLRFAVLGICLVCTNQIVCADEEVNFNRDIRPILSNNCFRCHGPDADHREAELRLDTFEGATSSENGTAAILPGDAEKSSAMKRMLSTNPEELMPPPQSELKLTAKQIELVRKWIQAGAKYESHWAFTPVVAPGIPAVRQPDWIENPIDNFVLHTLEQKEIAPSGPADRTTWLRRASLDLLGLPPSVQDLRSFRDDLAPDAFERQVDRLLASPRYGERWGRHWLDQARYADSNGYTVDSDRNIWPYRDWVISAVNDDMPFDQFTIDQLAGDLLDDPLPSQLVATGFHRNTLVNQEGGTDAEQFRNEAMVDRVNTTGAVWLGLTVGCAQCHNHKYDPFSQREFYQLFAFFNSDQDVNTITPTLSLPSDEDKQVLANLDQQLDDLRSKQVALKKARTEQTKVDQTGKENQASDKDVWRIAQLEQVRSERNASFKHLDDDSWLVTPSPESDQYQFQFRSPVSAIAGLRLEALTDDSLPSKGPGTAKNGNFVLAEVRVWVDDKSVSWKTATADHSQANYAVVGAIDNDPKTGWAINVDKGNSNQNRTAIFVTSESPSTKDKTVRVELLFSDKPTGYNLGRFRIAVTDRVPESILDQTDPEISRLQQQIADLEKQKKEFSNKIPTTLVMKQLAKPRDSFIHIRGDFLRHGDPVIPQTPSAIAPQIDASEDDAGQGTDDRDLNPDSNKHSKLSTRLDLAKWLVDSRNPLVPRVTVNRIWSHFFPRGLVETENDFGIQGTPPSHPELLDWLAAEFRDTGWSTKKLHRLIVLSATYRQSSASRPELQAIDPNNKLLARQSRLRVDAEIVRDCALSASGLLTHRIGGPGVFPPQPEGVYAFTQGKPPWPTSTGENRYRRGMYTFFRRSAPYPMLTTFDTPRFDTVCTARIRSNTPLQSLTMSNDQAMVEMSIALGNELAAAVIAETPRVERSRTTEDSIRTAIEHGFERCFARKPSSAESQSVQRYYHQQKTAFESNPEAASQLLASGPFADESKRWDKPRLVEVAAWSTVARVLMNLDEFVTRE